MKVLSVAGAVLVISATATACRPRDEERFVALGHGAISGVQALTVIAVATALETVNYDGKTVRAGPGHKYVLLDCRVAASPKQVEFDDFQLVRDRAAKIGQEVNIGDNRDDDYFYWSFLDPSGRPVPELPGSLSSFAVRLAFKVPRDAQSGYLFYWGLYWGPVGFEGTPR